MIRRIISAIRRKRDWKRQHLEEMKTFPTRQQWEMYQANCDYRERRDHQICRIS